MRRLAHEEVASVLELRRAGMTLRQIADKLKLSDQAVWYWVKQKRLKRLTSDGIKVLRLVHNKNWHLNTKLRRVEQALKAAAFVIRMYEPSPRRRGNLIAPIRARFHLPRSDTNKLLGLRPNAGEGRRPALADRLVIGMMEDFLKECPRSGFETIFKAVLKGKPGTKLRALEIYTEFFKGRHTKLIKQPSRPVRHLQVQGAPNQMWSMDYMHALLQDGKTFWVLNAIDDFNREVLVSKAMKRRSAKEVVLEIQKLIQAGRAPKAIRTDNGGEFKSLTYKTFLKRNQIQRVCTRYRAPNDNAYVEKFNDFVRSEVLRDADIETIEQAQLSLDTWALRYNFVRPHGALGGLSPMQASWVHLKGQTSRFG